MAATTSTPALLASTNDILSRIDSYQSENPFSIARLSEPLTSSLNQSRNSDNSRSSFSTSSSQNQITPSTLTSDLSHYRDLFTKLHFSYIEQVTKEKYLRAIVGDPPLLHTHQENVELETENVAMKAALKEKKVGIEEMVEVLSKESRDLAKQWERLETEITRTRELEQTVREREAKVESLRQEVSSKESQIMSLNSPNTLTSDHSASKTNLLGLEDTLNLISQLQSQLHQTTTKIQHLQTSTIPTKDRECERVERDLEALEMRKNEITEQAREARRRKEMGGEGGRDEVEERGRWYRGQLEVLNGVGLA